MANIDLKSQFTEYLYNRLPSIYRTTDKEELLRRFIECFVEGGFAPLLQETQEIMNILDVDKCPSQFLPNLCAMYGYEYTLELPELFQRRLLKHIVELYKRKGTKSVVRFIARELTGFESEIIENKDFTPEQIELTHWDKRFEHYRNFILKLTAPYEDSQLYNKEDIVIKLVKDFIPTNSQVFVITSYWFKEESEVIKLSKEEISDLVRDYNEEVSRNTLTTKQIQDIYKVKHKVEEESITYFGEEESSTNNFPPLVTNGLMKVHDKVIFALESYSKFIKPQENGSSDKNIFKEGDYSLNQHYTYKDSIKTKDKSHTEVTNLDTQETNIDTFRRSESMEARIFDKSLDPYTKGKIKHLPDHEEIDIQGCTRHSVYDIIRSVEEENHSNSMINITSETSLLNFSSCLVTNGIHGFDIIKQVGKEDKIIFY